ncbi:hypothetical protein BDV93DRAFT_517769 [Ceratobasidium sp. AG-I]|nr:hypothetical protein BDV93DRAFT_517769 [Ceratobasidium sp. AG-I]
MSEPFTFDPPPGGDLVIKSSDGREFRAHSSLLALASSVFSGMFSATFKPGTTDLVEDAESISLMLSFIYPSSFTTIDSFEALEKSLRMADKYDIPGILKALDYTVSNCPSNKNLAHRDPVRVFKLSSQYGLRETRTLAASLIQPRHYDFHDPKQLRDFATHFPGSSHLIGLVGAQGARLKIICEVLFNYDPNNSSILPELDNKSKNKDEFLMCKPCLTAQKSTGGHYFPSWLPDWSWLAFERLSTESLEDCQDIFSVSVLKKMTFSDGACKSCINAARTASGGRVFEKWAEEMNVHFDDLFSWLDHQGLHAL